MKTTSKFNFFLILSLFLVTTVYADLLPADVPCRVEGSFLVDGNAPNSSNTFQLDSYVAGTNYKNITVNSGSYILTVGGNNGDAIALEICGINAGSTTLTAYSTKTVNVNFTSQANGVTGCTCATVCSGNYCVNPGRSTGVCSSTSYYCDNDGSCEASYGETTSTCVNDCPAAAVSSSSSSSGGGGGGGGSSSYLAATTYDTDSAPTTTDTSSTTVDVISNDLKDSVATSLDIDSDDIESITEVDSRSSQVSYSTNSLIKTLEDIFNSESTTSEIAKTELNNVAAKLDAGEYESVRVQAQLKVYEVKTKSGQTKKVSQIELKYVADKDMEVAKIIEVIPKDVALSASDLEFSVNPSRILQDDPIIEWTFNNVKKGESLAVNYVVNKELSSIDSQTIAAAKESLKPLSDENYLQISESGDDYGGGLTGFVTGDGSTSSGSFWYWMIGIVLVVLIALGIIYFVGNRRKKNQFEIKF